MGQQPDVPTILENLMEPAVLAQKIENKAWRGKTPLHGAELLIFFN